MPAVRNLGRGYRDKFTLSYRNIDRNEPLVLSDSPRDGGKSLSGLLGRKSVGWRWSGIVPLLVGGGGGQTGGEWDQLSFWMSPISSKW